MQQRHAKAVGDVAAPGAHSQGGSKLGSRSLSRNRIPHLIIGWFMSRVILCALRAPSELRCACMPGACAGGAGSGGALCGAGVGAAHARGCTERGAQGGGDEPARSD